MNGRELPDCFKTVGELIYLVEGRQSEALADVTRAASGRIARSVLIWVSDPIAVLEGACVDAGASVRPLVFAEAFQLTRGEGFIVSIRREDRERFEETMAGCHIRWIGETTAAPGLRFS